MKYFSRLILVVVLFPLYLPAYSAEQVRAENLDLTLETLATGLVFPWSMAFLPDQKLLVTQRTGQLRRLDLVDGLLVDIAGLPDIEVTGQGGLMDVILDPDFATNQLVYFSYVGGDDNGYGTEVMRARLAGESLQDQEVIFRALPKQGGGRHFGSRLLFAPDGNLFISLGDRGNKDNGQDINTHAGSLIRIQPDGSVPAGNPFVDNASWLPEAYTIGNRNMQGMALDPDSATLWTHEHGPQGGDELNLMQPGHNYGWPVITYGKNYIIGTDIGEGTHKQGMQQPVYYWVPSIAPSGMTFYSGEAIPEWHGNLLLGSLKFGLLVRLVLENNEVVHEERLLQGKYGRIRDVRQGPDGAVYLLTDAQDGKLLRLQKLD